MSKVLSWIVVIGGLLAVILLAIAQLKQAAAERAYARAYVIAQQGQARLDTLTGVSAVVSAAVPHVVTLAIIAVSVCLVVLFVIWLRDLSDSRAYRLAMLRQTEPRVIERIETRTILLLPGPDMSRRELLQLVSGADLRQLPAVTRTVTNDRR